MILVEEKGKDKNRVHPIPTTFPTVYHCDERNIAPAFKEHTFLGKGGKQTPKQEREVNC